MGVSHSKQSLDISSTPKKAEVNGKAAAVEEVKAEEKITVKLVLSYGASAARLVQKPNFLWKLTNYYQSYLFLCTN